MKKNNKGFSLVELIVVIAIMAVLMVVLTPALLRYVERSRLQRDNTAIAEVANAAKIACASENINNEVRTSGPVTISFTIAATPANPACSVTSGTITNFQNEISNTIGTMRLQSNTYNDPSATLPTLTVEIDGTSQAVIVTGTNIISDVGGTAGNITY